MNEIEKYKLYIRYYSTIFKLKYSFSIKYEGEQYYIPQNWNKPDKIIGSLHLRYLWKNIKEPVSFNEFCKNSNNQEGINHWYMLVNNKQMLEN